MLRQMNNKDFEVFNWGPFLCKFEITKEETDMLFEVVNKSLTHPTRELNNIVSEEKKLNKEKQVWFLKYFFYYFNTYIKNLVIYNNQSVLKTITGLKSTDIWVNFMKENDFIPPHIHSGDLSFVLYLEVPKSLTENKEYSVSNNVPGGIQFSYGESNSTNIPSSSIIQHSFLPKVGDFYIFPANLNHYVFPFKGDGTRISLAGNINYTFNDNI